MFIKSDLGSLHYKHKLWQMISVSGMWIINTTTIYYTKETQVTLWCKMRFNLYPVDTQNCKFKMGSFSYHLEQITFTTKKLFLHHKKRRDSAVSDYIPTMSHLSDADKILIRDDGLINISYSIAGFELKLVRNSLKYYFNYYLPSGLFTVVSWVRNFPSTFMHKAIWTITAPGQTSDSKKNCQKAKLRHNIAIQSCLNWKDPFACCAAAPNPYFFVFLFTKRYFLLGPFKT